MRSIEEYAWCIDHRTVKFLTFRVSLEKEFIKNEGDKKAYDALQKSKVGYIRVRKISDNPGIEKNKEYSGVTACFGEGLSMWLSSQTSWFRTSVIQDIDWEKKIFHTMNSIYAFDFEELEYEDFIHNLLNQGIESVPRNDS